MWKGQDLFLRILVSLVFVFCLFSAIQTTQLFLFYYTNLTLLKLGGETAVLVWPRAHPSLMPASLVSSSIHPLFQISLLHSLPPTLFLITAPLPFYIIFSDLIFPASPPTCPFVLTRQLRSISLFFLSAHPHLPTSSCLCHRTTCIALVKSRVPAKMPIKIFLNR